MAFQPFPWRDWETGHRINAQRLNGPAREIVAGTELYIEQGFEVRATGNPWEVEVTPGRAYWCGYLLQLEDAVAVQASGSGDYVVYLDPQEQADPQGGYTGVDFSVKIASLVFNRPVIASVTFDGSGNVTRIRPYFYPRAGFQNDLRLLFAPELLLCGRTDFFDNAFRSPIFTASGSAVLEDYWARLPISGVSSAQITHYFRSFDIAPWVKGWVDLRISLACNYNDNPANDSVYVTLSSPPNIGNNCIGFRLVPRDEILNPVWDIYAYREEGGAVRTDTLINSFRIGSGQNETHLRLFVRDLGTDTAMAFYMPVLRLGTQLVFVKESLPSDWTLTGQRLYVTAEGTDAGADFEVRVVSGLIITD